MGGHGSGGNRRPVGSGKSYNTIGAPRPGSEALVTGIPPCICRGGGWYNAGCKRHRPIRSFCGFDNRRKPDWDEGAYLD